MRLLLLVLSLLATACDSRVFADTIACVTSADCPADLSRCANGTCTEARRNNNDDDTSEGEGEVGEGEGEGGEGEGEVGEGEGEGEARIPCATSDTCPGDLVCVEQTCGRPCADTACPAGEVCVIEGLFSPVAGCVPGCSDDNDCSGATPVCDPQAPHECRPRSGNGDIAALCINDNECDGAFVCFRVEGDEFGFCTERCTVDDETIGPTDCTTFPCCQVSGLNRCSLGFCQEACDDDVCANGGAGCCPATGLNGCFIDLCTFR